MEQFLTYLISFPVVVYTFLFGLVIFYWLLAIIGAVDIELLDVDFDMDVDVDAEGLSGAAGIMFKWGLTGVPVTVILSALIASSWLICYLLVSVTFPMLHWEVLKWALGVVYLPLSFVIAIPFTAWLTKPLKSLFKSHDAVRKSSLIGRECVIKTGKVTLGFGQAELDDGEAGMILDVRADEAYGIKKGDLVILMSYDETDGSFQVAKSKD